jgi:hypothetical protein
VFEYAHGGTTRLKTLHPGLAFGCSIDPMTGNLAVADGATGPTGRGTAGNLAIYTRARGKPKCYRDSAFHFYYFCGYDSQGNLFIDGDATAEPYSVVFAELPRGGSKLETITLNHSLGYAGGVQWDGAHVAITDPRANAVYQFAINGSQAALVGTTPLNGTNSIIQPWIQGQKIIVPNALVPGGNVLIYKYPAGGAPIKKTPLAGGWNLKGRPLARYPRAELKRQAPSLPGSQPLSSSRQFLRNSGKRTALGDVKMAWPQRGKLPGLILRGSMVIGFSSSRRYSSGSIGSSLVL